ncbi:HTTM domain-containing protein [Patiriisocius hiemis]|uniref:HTTM domain-containing protein n=1 Tax=Patiriisocius hiemis TaxID=3075604 RepID=A0ABU2Y9J6_9FLAO|nr:HTTM domain-containing protein [Constantimarinum sp. W242]MDT0554697.1 HTTM domain-containing protein [Constantimarinum sp. W242]
MSKTKNTYFNTYTKAAPLAVFRIFFGVMMCASIVRFWSKGWIDKLYINPTYFFKYYGFEWVQSPGIYTYLLFALCGLSALFVAVGYKYRIAIITFFLSFTYIELLDKTTYLNHYYFISILSFLLIFLPANAYFSLDSKINPKIFFTHVPKWTIDSIKLLLFVVYFYAGLAKLNSDWLFNAMPLKIWLPSKYDIPLLGSVLQQEWLHYTFSWSGALYDLLIPFLLLCKPTRWFAFGLVVIFHVLTRVLFPIGMFPYIMIVSALIFFDSNVHDKILRFIAKTFMIGANQLKTISIKKYQLKSKGVILIVCCFFIVQLIFPWRYLAYPGELFWTEEGYRFSWRVMLMEKAGYAQFKIKDTVSGKQFFVDNSDFLTPFQEKQMSTQPDFILQYAQFLGDHFNKEGHENIAVFVESYVALNGRLSQLYINPEVDLLKQRESFKHKDWILKFNDEIKGL